jgi:hypothetical protein
VGGITALVGRVIGDGKEESTEGVRHGSAEEASSAAMRQSVTTSRQTSSRCSSPIAMIPISRTPWASGTTSPSSPPRALQVTQLRHHRRKADGHDGGRRLPQTCRRQDLL